MTDGVGWWIAFYFTFVGLIFERGRVIGDFCRIEDWQGLILF